MLISLFTFISSHSHSYSLIVIQMFALFIVWPISSRQLHLMCWIEIRNFQFNDFIYLSMASAITWKLYALDFHWISDCQMPIEKFHVDYLK